MLITLHLFFPAIKVNEKRDISVITKGVGKSDGPVKVTMTTPSKKKVNIPVKDSMETWKGQLVPTEVGPHVIDVTYGSFVVPKSPFTINVTSSCDMSKVKVVGLDKRKLLCVPQETACSLFYPCASTTSLSFVFHNNLSCFYTAEYDLLVIISLRREKNSLDFSLGLYNSII